MPNNHEHDRFLYEKDGYLHFGCINPFCGHGDPALPNHWKVPMQFEGGCMKLLYHIGRKVAIEVTRYSTGEKTTLVTDNNLEACREEFQRLFPVAR